MARTCRTPITREDPMVVLDRVEGFAKQKFEEGERDGCYAMPLQWILQIANIIRDLKGEKEIGNAMDKEQ